MKKALCSLLLFLLVLPLTLRAEDSFVNLTPRPKNMEVGKGSLVLPEKFTIYHSLIEPQMTAEATRFANELAGATGLAVTASTGDVSDGILFHINHNPNARFKTGGYRLSINENGVRIEVKEQLGLYYAFQTVKKILPPNVMAGVRDQKVKEYALPYVTINDEPRYEYRGFMLDVARHFFTVDEVKRMLDVMAYYKMNRFHWHLSDDQGWRVEIKKYPRLTSVGSIAPNSRFTDMFTCTQYWINRPYGPYFYTQDEIREVVAYARERHIEIIPEIDMPGHFVAALAAYPEYSCNPDGQHTIWTDGGISADVMNVGNPKAVQFAKDILTEIMDLFPYETIHIGGDECPTSAWEGNALCRQIYEKEKLTSYRQLQSRFIKEMGDFVKEKGRKLAVWNEAITAGGADLNLVKATGALVYCWTGPEAAAKKAKQLGLKNIYTPWGPYYINRRQGNSPLDPPGAGDGSDDVRKTYNTTPPAETDYGVQGTFWSEHVSDRNYLEWLALPRLIAIAEAGWTPQNRKNFEDFRKRMTADTTLLNYRSYRYCKYHMTDSKPSQPEMELPLVNTDGKKYYYRLISGATDKDRKGRCIELLAEGSPLITQYAGKNAKPGTLWTNAQAAEGAVNYDAQWWSLEEDPENKGKFALVCKAQPAGSLKPQPTVATIAGRWTYDNTGKHYNFVLGTGSYGTTDGNHFYSIASDLLNGQFLNSSLGGQGFAVNVYANPKDGNGGCWQFAPMENYKPGKPETPVTFTPLTQGATYVFTNAIEGYNATMLADHTRGNRLSHTANPFGSNVWTITEAGQPQSDGTQTVKLQNVQTGRFIASLGNFADREGTAVNLSNSEAAALTLKFEPQTADLRLQLQGKSFFPLPAGMVNAGATIRDAAYDAPRLQGAAWKAEQVTLVTFVCTDDQGNPLGTLKRGIKAGSAVTLDLCPTFRNTQPQGLEAAGENVYNVSYKRIAFDLTLRALDTRGAIISESVQAVPTGETVTFNAPELKYYTLERADKENGSKLTLKTDLTVTAHYTTEALSGVKKLGNAVTSELKEGHSYVFFDASPDNNNARQGYRRILANTKAVNRYLRPEGMDPSATWTLEKADGGKFKVKNECYSLYIPLLQRGGKTVAADKGDSFAFSLNADGETWNIKGSNGMYWDGNENGEMVGWNGGTGHPIKLYEYYVQPYFRARVNCVTSDGKTLLDEETLVPAGEAWTLSLPTFNDYEVVEVTGNEDYEGTMENHLSVTVTYKHTSTAIGNVEVATGNADRRSGIYDLQGRRLQRIPQQGIYIVNGKKVLVK